MFEDDTLLHNAIITSKEDAAIRDRLIKANLFFCSNIVQEFNVNKPATDRVKHVNNKSAIAPSSLNTPNNAKIAINADNTTKIIVNKENFFFINIPP